MTDESLPPNGSPDLGKHLRGLPWDHLHPRLQLEAEYKIRRIVWRGKFLGRVPGGRMSGDAIHEAVLKFLSGERKWNWSKSDYENLWGAVSSLISNWSMSAENNLTSQVDDEKVVLFPDVRPTPEEDAEWESERKHFLHYLSSNDVEAAQMAEYMLDHGLEGPELARVMGLSPREVENIKKRLKRLTKSYLDKDDQADRRGAK